MQNQTAHSLDLRAPSGEGLVAFVRVSNALSEGGYTPDAFRDMVLSQSELPFEDRVLTAQGFAHALVLRLRDLGTVSLPDDTQWQFQETSLRVRWHGALAQLRTRVAIHDAADGTYSGVLSLIGARQDRWSALKRELAAVERTVAPSGLTSKTGTNADNPLTDRRSAFWSAAIPGRSLCAS